MEDYLPVTALLLLKAVLAIVKLWLSRKANAPRPTANFTTPASTVITIETRGPDGSWIRICYASGKHCA